MFARVVINQIVLKILKKRRDKMKFICFSEKIPAIIGGKSVKNRQPRKFTRWITTLFMWIFTKEAK